MSYRPAMAKLPKAAYLALFCGAIAVAGSAFAERRSTPPGEVLLDWYELMLKLVEQTPGYSPPVASRAFAYVGVAAFEVVAANSRLQSLAGQLNELAPLPKQDRGASLDTAAALHAALSASIRTFFESAPTEYQARIATLEATLSSKIADDLPAGVLERSTAYGRAVASHVLKWSSTDGAALDRAGFPVEYQPASAPGHWVPTSDNTRPEPLLPGWGTNRPFAMPSGAECSLPPPPTYSEDPASQFYREAREVYETSLALTAEQAEIAIFWSDDPALTPTPPGHWISIALQVLDRTDVEVENKVDVLARLGVALADAFIGCWHDKFRFDLVRPETYIRATMAQDWTPFRATPPFPEYPSGHSTQSGAAATVLTALFGEDFAFQDSTHATEGLAPRKFPSFWAAAEEAGISRLYGGIHFRSAIERGLDQGRCIGSYANALRTWE